MQNQSIFKKIFSGFQIFKSLQVKKPMWLIFRNILQVVDYKQVTSLQVHLVIEKVSQMKHVTKRKEENKIHKQYMHIKLIMFSAG